jgi:pimeloyl-ACP methyl ester carboxylesterase
MLRDEYESAAKLAAFDRPVVVAVAEYDSVVPAHLGLSLHAAIGGPKLLLVVKGRDHNDWPDRVTVNWWRTAIAFALGDER